MTIPAMPARAADFDYDEAFSRNIGWVTEWEQQILRTKRIAIAGMGGVGGVHLLTLARLGIGSFHVADMDVFETVNFNRQIGASTATVGRPKVDVMAGMARDINPTAEIRRFPNGINDDNIDDFLDGVDLFIDGFDFFVIDIRAKVFARCAELGIPAITAGPIGMGTAYLVFMPGQMTFEQYFGLDGQPVEQQYVNFLVGLTPRAMHRSYLVDPTRLDLVNQRGPSTAMACQLCAGVTGIEALKILLDRGDVKAAPWFHQFDAYTGRLVSKRLPGGSRHIGQRLKQKLGARMMRAIARTAPKPQPDAAAPESRSEMWRILDLARWAPSGDNSQPWRFRIDGDDAVTIIIHHEAGTNVYEYNDGQPTLLSAGHLLETLRIAASRYGRRMEWSHRRVNEGGNGSHEDIISVRLPRQPGLRADPLDGFVRLRSVDRTSYSTTPLTDQQKAELANALGPDLKLSWFDARPQRRSFAQLNGLATDIRLRCREAYDVHRRMLDWDNRFSPAGLPATAIGLDRMTRSLMRWAMKDWSRVKMMNLAGTGAASFQIDRLPGVNCAGHFTVTWRNPRSQPATPEDLLRAGERLQRFWLTATMLGLALQPGLAPIAFSTHALHGVRFTEDPKLLAKAEKLAVEVSRVTGTEVDQLVFMGRIGRPKSMRSTSRSHRRPLEELIVGEEKGGGFVEPAPSPSHASHGSLPLPKGEGQIVQPESAVAK
ncbi:molybdopterin/thiamine biosynthesis adenylyltransferase [Skermanella aerolata]|uniref:ThiF family adenylyltransferase n=1 Tax=Skermanella aerolata TaxID=393310 RepID=UPI003D210C9E